MNIPAFAKPGEKDVVSPSFRRRIKVDGVQLRVGFYGHCWIGNSRIEIEVHDGLGSFAIYKSRRMFRCATMKDLDTLIRRIKLARCSRNKCKNRYIVSDDKFFNPLGVCGRHWQDDFDKSVAEIEAKEKAETDLYDSKKKAKGYRYKGIVWIHRDHGDDYALWLYFKSRPSKQMLVNAAKQKRSRLLHDYSIIKL